MKVAGIIINYCTPELTLEATACLSRELGKVAPSHVYVIDNASPDDSFAKLQAGASGAAWENHATIVRAPKNGGYGYGINFGAGLVSTAESPADYLYALNSDALVTAAGLSKLLASLDDNPRVALASGRVEAMSGEVQGAAFRFPTLFSELEGNAKIGAISSVLKQYHISLPEPQLDTLVDWVPGTGMMLRRTVFEELGGFDEAFFLYFEEVDFAKRVQDAGYQVQFVADAALRHIGSASTKLDTTRRLPTYWYDSRHRYFVKHHGRRYAACADAAALLGHTISAVRNRVIPSKTNAPPREGAFVDLVRSSFKHVFGSAAAAEPPAD